MRTVTIALPDPVKLPDTTRALPERSEVPLRAALDEPAGGGILAELDDILADMPGSTDPGGGVAKPVSPVAGPPVPDDDLFSITMDGESTPPPPGT